MDELGRDPGGDGEPAVLEMNPDRDAGRELGLGRRLEKVGGKVLALLELTGHADLKINEPFKSTCNHSMKCPTLIN